MKQQLDELKNKLAQNPKDSKTLRQLGWLYLNNHCFKKAKEEYNLAINFNPRLTAEILLDHERFIKQEPQNTPARLSLISFLLNSMDVAPAVLELEELIEIDPMNVSVYNILGKLYISLNKIDSALILLEKALEFGIKDIGISQMLAGVYLEKGRLVDAIRFYEDLFKYNPQDINLLRTLGELYSRTNKFNHAAESYFKLFLSDLESANEVLRKLEDLLIRDESNIRIREILAEIYMKSVKPDLAAEKLREILVLNPNKSEYIVEKSKVILKNYPNHPQTLVTLASVQADNGDFSEAIESYKKLIKSHPVFSELAISGCKDILKKYPDQYLAHQFLAETCLSNKNIKEAISEMKKLLELHKDSADWVIHKCRDHTKKEPALHEIIGLAYSVKGNNDKAITEAETLLAQNKENAAGHILLGKVYLDKNLTRKAIDSLQNALRLSPYDISLHQILKNAQLKELALEEEAIKKRMSEDEWKLSHHLDLAKVYIKMDRRLDAIKELQLASRDNTEAYNLMAELYIEEGKFNLAHSVLKKALEEVRDHFHPIFHELHFKLASCYEAQGNIKKAIKVLEEILSSDIDFPGLPEKIKYLKTSSLKSMQTKTLAMVIFDPQENQSYALWGREQKSGGRRQNITASFGQSHNNSGFDYFIKGMFKAALEEFDLASKIDPAFVASINNLGISYVKLDRLNEAIEKFKEALRLDPASSILLNNLGAAYFLSQDLSNAKKYLQKSKEINPELAAAALNLGDTDYKMDHPKEAIESYQSVEKQNLLYSLATKRLTSKAA